MRESYPSAEMQSVHFAPPADWAKSTFSCNQRFLSNYLGFAEIFHSCRMNLKTSCYIYLPNPSARAGYDTRSIFKWSLTGLNSEFSFSLTSFLTKAEEPSLSCYLPIAGGRIIEFIPFPRVLVLCEMQSVSSRIWTRVAVSISYDDNYYTTDTSCYKSIVSTV